MAWWWCFPPTPPTHFPSLLGDYSQMGLGWRVNLNEIFQVSGSDEQNLWVALLAAAAHLSAYLFPSDFSSFFFFFSPQCPPLKKIDVAGNGEGINMNNKLFLHVWSYRPIILAL